MDDGPKVSGAAVGALAAGTVLVWAGIKGYSLATTVQDVIKGTSPLAQTQVTPIGTPSVAAPAGAGASQGSAFPNAPALPIGDLGAGGTNAQNEALGKQMAAAAPYGWTGAQWTALNNVVMAESGWDDEAANPKSNARGIAQNINGWSSDYQAGNAPQQIAWLLAYVRSRYGTPILAWAFHLANGWY